MPRSGSASTGLVKISEMATLRASEVTDHGKRHKRMYEWVHAERTHRRCKMQTRFQLCTVKRILVLRRYKENQCVLSAKKQLLCQTSETATPLWTVSPEFKVVYPPGRQLRRKKLQTLLDGFQAQQCVLRSMVKRNDSATESVIHNPLAYCQSQ